MVLCQNCRCDIDESKMFLHQRFCIQNIKYCEECQVGVIIEEYEEHLQSHNNNGNNSNNSKRLSKEESDSLTLKRVQSSKIGCQYCGFLCGFGDIEEHESFCGARSTNCKQCGKRILIKDLKPHIEKEHKLNMESYQNMDSKSFDSNKYLNNNSNNSNNSYNNISGLSEKFTNLDLKRMTSDEEIAYALALCAEDDKKRREKEEKEKKEKEQNKYNPKVSDNFQKNNNLDVKKKPSEKIDYDELEYEYEKEMYEEELKNFEEENK